MKNKFFLHASDLSIHQSFDKFFQIEHFINLEELHREYNVQMPIKSILNNFNRIPFMLFDFAKMHIHIPYTSDTKDIQ